MVRRYVKAVTILALCGKGCRFEGVLDVADCKNGAGSAAPGLFVADLPRRAERKAAGIEKSY